MLCILLVTCIEAYNVSVYEHAGAVLFDPLHHAIFYVVVCFSPRMRSLHKELIILFRNMYMVFYGLLSLWCMFVSCINMRCTRTYSYLAFEEYELKVIVNMYPWVLY